MQTRRKVAVLIAEMFRSTSAELFGFQLNSSASVGDFNPNALSPDARNEQCGTAIELSTRKMTVVFEVRLDREVARRIGATVTSLAPTDFTEDLADDYAREFCNVAAGRVKHHLLRLGPDLLAPALGIPRNTPNPHPDIEGPGYDDRWLLTEFSYGPLLCAVTFASYLDELRGADQSWDKTIKTGKVSLPR